MTVFAVRGANLLMKYMGHSNWRIFTIRRSARVGKAFSVVYSSNVFDRQGGHR